MSKPTILAVNDDPEASAAITRDLRGRYGAGYRVVHATSGPEALEVLAKLALRGQPVALIVADQQMPQMTGSEMLELAGALGLRTTAWQRLYDVCIVGGGPADLAQRAIAQVSRFGAEMVLARDVVGFEARGQARHHRPGPLPLEDTRLPGTTKHRRPRFLGIRPMRGQPP